MLQHKIVVGDEWQHRGTGTIIKVIAVRVSTHDAVVREIYPTTSPDYHISESTLLASWHLITPGNSMGVQLTPPPSNHPQTIPSIGEIWVENTSKHEYEVVAVDYQIREVTMKNLKYPLSNPMISWADLWVYCHLKPDPTKAPKPRQGLAAWIPDDKLPPGQSNEFFGVGMAGLIGKCTCGIDTLGYGNHSDWCDKYKGDEK